MAFTGAESQARPPINACKIAMNLRTVGKPVPLNELNISECDSLPGCDIKFLDSQINGVAFMLQRSIGRIPVAKERAGDPTDREVGDSLKSVANFGVLPPSPKAYEKHGSNARSESVP